MYFIKQKLFPLVNIIKGTLCKFIYKNRILLKKLKSSLLSFGKIKCEYQMSYYVNIVKTMGTSKL